MKHLPVVIFSSLVSRDHGKKCTAAGADAQTTKNPMDPLVALTDRLVFDNQSQ